MNERGDETAGPEKPRGRLPAEHAGPLSGVRVLDCTRMVAGPMASLYLASLGAEVIRVEAPGGDLTWLVPPFFDADGEHASRQVIDEVSLSAIKRNRGKHSMVLSLTSASGPEVFCDLASTCDVLVENLRPGVLDRLGVGWEVVSARNARLIWCSLTGFGQFGPMRDRQAMDVTMQAISGVQSRNGFPDGPPVRGALLVGDLAPATFSVVGVLAALYERERTGVGQRIDVAMHDVLTSWLWDEPLDIYERDGRPARNGNAEPRGVPSNTYRCLDGWVALVVVSDPQWARLVTVLGREDLGVYRTNVDRVGARNQIEGVLADYCRQRRAGDVEVALSSIEVPVAVVREPAAALHEPQAQLRRSVIPMVDHHGNETGYLGPRLPVVFANGEPALGPPEPLGASTEHVLVNLLGYSESKIAALREAGTFGTGDS